MRPDTHKLQMHDRCCGNCVHAKWLAYKRDLLCFHGDDIEVVPGGDGDFVYLGGTEVNMLDGDEYDTVWAGRVVDADDVCDNWQGASFKGEDPKDEYYREGADHNHE